MAETPSVSNGAQRSENKRKNSLFELEIHCSDEIDFSSDSLARLFFQGKIGCDS
jgi:hypothetical protein